MNIGSNIVGRRSTALFIGATTGAAQQVIAAVPGYAIRVLGWSIIGSTAGTFLTFSDGAANSHANGPGSVPWLAPIADCGWFECAVGTALNLACSSAAAVVLGHIAYELVRA